MADKPPALPSYEPFPGSRTPGWNDPPTLQYNPVGSGAGSGRSRLNLNKRVAFPLQGTVSGEQNSTKPTAIVPPHVAGSCPVAVVHPMPTSNVPVSVPRLYVAPRRANDAEEGTRNTEPFLLPANAKETTLKILRDQVSAMQESPNIRLEEIQRRLGLIDEAWTNDSLSREVKEKVFSLAKCVAEKNSNEAMQIYTNLVMNHASECTMWAVALRHIVLTVQANNAATTNSTTASIQMNQVEAGEINNVASVRPIPMVTPIQTDEAINSETSETRSSIQHI